MSKSLAETVRGLRSFKKMETLEDHTACDSYINNLQITIKEKYLDPVNHFHWSTLHTAKELLCKMGQAKNQIKRHCIMRLGLSYTSESDFDLRKHLPGNLPAHLRKVDLKKWNEFESSKFCQEHQLLTKQLWEAAELFEKMFAKIIVLFYKTPITTKMASNVVKCTLSNWSTDLLYFYNVRGIPK
jgi:hypothetical protein